MGLVAVRIIYLALELHSLIVIIFFSFLILGLCMVITSTSSTFQINLNFPVMQLKLVYLGGLFIVELI